MKKTAMKRIQETEKTMKKNSKKTIVIRIVIGIDIRIFMVLAVKILRVEIVTIVMREKLDVRITLVVRIAIQTIKIKRTTINLMEISMIEITVLR